MDIESLEERIGSVQVVADVERSETFWPSLWTALLQADRTQRLQAFNRLADDAFSTMPQTREHLRKTTSDVYVVHSGEEYNLIVERRDEENDTLFYRSKLPKPQIMFGGKVGKFYSLLDGFCDLNDMGGLLPLRELLPLGKDGYEYSTEPSASLAAQLAHRDLRLVFNSGGKGKAYADLPSTQTDDPLAIVLWLDDDDPMVDMDFWDLIDNWTVIAMDE